MADSVGRGGFTMESVNGLEIDGVSSGVLTVIEAVAGAVRSAAGMIAVTNTPDWEKLTPVLPASGVPFQSTELSAANPDPEMVIVVSDEPT
jgi:hypothetical protein